MGLTVRIKGYVGAYDCGYITYGNFVTIYFISH